MRSNTLRQMWNSVADRGREILALRRGRPKGRGIESLCSDLLSERGQAVGTALAREVVERYGAMDEAGKLGFFTLLNQKFSPDVETVIRAVETYRSHPDPDALLALSRAVEPPRQELIRRINMAPNGTVAIVAMRETLLRLLPSHPQLRAVEADFRHLLRSWFNRGFLVLQRIDWNTPAAILEKLFEHEAVHEIQGWPDMRRRLEEDRRCFAFFHPALPDEPLIFVEVALLKGMASSIQPLLDRESPPQEAARADTALFYSISNTQDGLRGISFGNFLVKQVIAELLKEEPRFKTFATLSPAPGFRHWLASALEGDNWAFTQPELDRLRALKRANWQSDGELADSLKDLLLGLCAHYLLNEKESGEPLDTVARFHLGNGASIERINWLADTSARRIRQSAGIMVNYSYRPRQIEKNHEAYVHHGRIAASPTVKALVRKR